MYYTLLLRVTSFGSLTLSTTAFFSMSWIFWSNYMLLDETQWGMALRRDENFGNFENSLIKGSGLVVIASLFQFLASSALLASAGKKEKWTSVWSWAVATCLTTTFATLSFINVSSNQYNLSRECSTLVYAASGTFYLDQFYFILIVFSVVHALEIFLVTLTFGVTGDKLSQRPYRLMNI